MSEVERSLVETVCSEIMTARFYFFFYLCEKERCYLSDNFFIFLYLLFNILNKNKHFVSSYIARTSLVVHFVSNVSMPRIECSEENIGSSV